MKNIYVGNLPRTATEASLKDLFVTFGEVGTVKLIKDRYTGEPRGFGFVEMPDDAAADAAVNELNGHNYEGSSLRINEARPQENRPRTGGFGDSRSSGGSRDGNRSRSSGGFGGSRDGNRGGFGSRDGNRGDRY
ncbi:RNA-binding protein [Candidatus Dependentiae bacterium]|nr:MAG: RNA-binding protein [Candidatus Dependentiae bacterium]